MTKFTAFDTWMGEPVEGVTVRTMFTGRVTFTGIPQEVSDGFFRGLVVPRTWPLLEPNLHSKLVITVDGGVTEAVNVHRRTLPPPTCVTLQSAVLASFAVTLKSAVTDGTDVVVVDEVVVLDVVVVGTVVVVVDVVVVVEVVDEVEVELGEVVESHALPTSASTTTPARAGRRSIEMSFIGDMAR